MEADVLRLLSSRASRRTERNNQFQQNKVICSKESKVFIVMDNMGLVPKQHCCPIPILDDPDNIVIPESSPSDTLPQNLSYFLEDGHAGIESQSPPLFGGHQSWEQRDESFKLKPNMTVHCGFMRNGGAEMDAVDVEYAKKCKYVVASGIFDGYLWRGKNTVAIALHKHDHSIYEEADAIKRRKRYARPLIDLYMKIYRYEGMELWTPMKRAPSDVPEGAVIIREHTPLNSCSAASG